MKTKFQPTVKQMETWSKLAPAAMPSDEDFKAQWKKSHHGSSNGWGMAKRDWVIAHQNDHLTKTVEYNLGLWQGRLDAFLGIPSEKTENYHTDPFDHGYRSGYDGFDSFWKGFDQKARQSFSEKYSEKSQ